MSPITILEPPTLINEDPAEVSEQEGQPELEVTTAQEAGASSVPP